MHVYLWLYLLHCIYITCIYIYLDITMADNV